MPLTDMTDEELQASLLRNKRAVGERRLTIDRAKFEADEVSALIEAGKRVPRQMTEDLRNRVRELIRLLDSQ